MMAAFAAETLRDRRFEPPKDAEFSFEADDGVFLLRWVAPDGSRLIHLVQTMVSADAAAEGGVPTAGVDLRRAAEAQLGILDHRAAKEGEARVAPAMFRNAAFTIRKLVEDAGEPPAR
jgi:hypothetical protein